MTFRIWESFRAVFYAPYYAAFALEMFEKEGIDAHLGAVPPGVDVAEALRAGEVDVAWGGPMRVMIDHDRHPERDLTCFCEVVARDPFYLVGAQPRPDFSFGDLFGLRVATVGEVPTPWMCLQEDLRRIGLDPDRLQRVPDNTMAENAEALQRGEVDVAQLFEPDVQHLLERGAGHVWCTAADRGPTTYTSFFARRAFLEARPEAAYSLARAMRRTQEWMRGISDDEFAEVVADYFPGLARSTLVAAIGMYRRNRVWADNPVMTREGFDRLAAGFVSGGLLRVWPSWERCVDLRFAEAAVAGLSASAGAGRENR